MSFTLRAATVADAPSLGRTNMSAFYQDPHWRLMWASMPLADIIEGAIQRLPRALTSSLESKRHQVAIDSLTGEAVGYARWVLSPALVRPGDTWPEAQVASATTDELAAYAAQAAPFTVKGRPKGANVEMIDAMNPKLDAEDARLKGMDDWLELEYLCVRPEYQRRGIGEMLVRSGMAVADQHGVYTIVMASTMHGQSLYKRCGFNLISTVVQDDSPWGGSPTGSVNSWYRREAPKSS